MCLAQVFGNNASGDSEVIVMPPSGAFKSYGFSGMRTTGWQITRGWDFKRLFKMAESIFWA